MSIRRVISVVGCGNIGSRHLQGLASLTMPAVVYACDPDAAARKLAAERVAQVAPGAHLSFEFVDEVAKLPVSIDLAIVATGAKSRRAVIDTLVTERKIGGLLLEKFLFQRHSDYEAIGDLLQAHGVPTFVNTPRRAWPAYRRLREDLAGKGPITVTVELGHSNGLSTNAIHFIDITAFLADAPDGFNLDGRRLTVLSGVSRHAATLEFGGVMIGLSALGDCLTLRGRPESSAPHVVVIAAADRRLLINESRQEAFVASQESDWAPRRIAFPVPFQSALTGGIAAEMLVNGTALLPTFVESARLHRQCLSAFLTAMGQSGDDANTVCPVT